MDSPACGPARLRRFMPKRWLVCAVLAGVFLPVQFGLERPGVTFKIFQFPPDKIPRIDGNTDDWAMVPDSYAIGMDQLMDTEHGHGMNHDPKNMDVKVKVGWVKGLNRLYFLYEARSEEHTSELQSLRHLVCRLLLEKKK